MKSTESNKMVCVAAQGQQDKEGEFNTICFFLCLVTDLLVTFDNKQFFVTTNF